MIRMVPKSLELWMLFLWIQIVAAGEPTDCGNKTGILEEAVELKCCYPHEDLTSSPFRVQWQLEGNDDCVVDAHLPNLRTPLPQCEHYKTRAKLQEDYLHLQLLNLSLEDSRTYKCILQQRIKGEFQKIFQGWIRLEVAANNRTNATKYPESPTSKPHTEEQQTKVAAIICSIAAVVIIIIIVLIWYKRNRSFHRAHTAPVQVDIL